MSSFRRGKTDPSLRLYSLPRRELQALCKQYGIPTNKTNVGMADALSACVPVDHVKPKASWTGANSLRVAKTTPLKMKMDRATGLPDTSLVSFTSNGKRKTSPVTLAEKPAVADIVEANSLKSHTTPLRRGVKRSERNPIQTLHEEKTKATATPTFTRAAFLQDRFGKSVTATSSYRPPVPTPGKRQGKVAETVSRSRGGDALPPGLLSTPKTSELQMRRTISKHPPEPMTESIEAEIEFRNAALHKELFGVRRDVTMVKEMAQDATPVAREAKGFVTESLVEVGFEFRDMALHKELFGSHPTTNATSSQGYYVHSPAHDLQGLGAIDMVSSERRVFTSPFTSSTEVLDYSGHEIRVLSSIPEEGASDDSESKMEQVADQHIQMHQMPLGRDLGPLLDGMSCDSPACSLSSMEVDTNLAVAQTESVIISPRMHVPALTKNIQSSPLVKAATTPLTKIRTNIGCTLTKATLILEKLAALREDAEKKSKEGYWEPKFSAVVASPSPAAVFDTALVVDMDLPSTKKARLTPKSMMLGSEKGSVVCEAPSGKTIRIPDESRDLMSDVSDKENQSPMTGMDDWMSRRSDGLGKEKKGEKMEVLKDRSQNMLDHVNNKINEPGMIKLGVGEVRPEEMSLRKLRAQFKEKIRHLEASKASDLRPWSQGGWS